MSIVTVNKSHATINVGSNASCIVNGDDDIINAGANSSVTANGFALSLQVTGAGSVVTIGGNGVAASNAHDNAVAFKGVAGTVHELANARTEVTGNSVTATMAGNDALGLYGAGDAVGASGVGNSIWIGQNGDGVFGAGMDYVLGLTHGSVYEMQGSSVATDGSYYNATLAAQDLLLASGLGVHVTVTAAGDTVYIGGNGSGASSADEDVVLFQAAGTINVTANSRIDATGSHVTAALAGNDTFGLYGSYDTVTARGTGDAIWIGQNGGLASAAVDVVHGLTQGSIYEMQGSDVNVDGTNYSVTMAGDDTLVARGAGVSISENGNNNLIGASNSTVNAAFKSNFELIGDNNAIVFGGHGSVEVLGGGNHLSIAGASTVTVGGYHDSVAANSVQWTESTLYPTVTVLAHSLASLSGTFGLVVLGGDDAVTVTGSGIATTDTAGRNAITIGGNGYSTDFVLPDQVTLSTADRVSLLANSSVIVSNPGAATTGQYSVQMAADDALSIGAGVTVHVPLAAGDDYLANFAATDVLSLAAHFTSVDDLLAHTGFNHLNQTMIQLDTNGDNLILGFTKTDLATYANAGLVKFA